MLMELILSRENLIAAFKRVVQNKGSHGVDGMSVKELRRHLFENWDSIRQSLREGTYKPLPLPSSRNAETERWGKASRDPYRD